jgi:hypothetical protein
MAKTYIQMIRDMQTQKQKNQETVSPFLEEPEQKSDLPTVSPLFSETIESQPEDVSEITDIQPISNRVKHSYLQRKRPFTPRKDASVSEVAKPMAEMPAFVPEEKVPARTSSFTPVRMKTFMPARTKTPVSVEPKRPFSTLKSRASKPLVSPIDQGEEITEELYEYPATMERTWSAPSVTESEMVDELMPYFTEVSERGARDPHEALQRLLPYVASFAAKEFNATLPNTFQSVEFNPYLTKRRVDAFCEKWGADLNNKVLIVFHGTQKKVHPLIFKSNLRPGSNNVHGEGIYLTTKPFTALQYNLPIRPNDVNELMGCLVVVNRNTVLDLRAQTRTGYTGNPRPPDFVVVVPTEADAVLPLFLIKYIEPSVRNRQTIISPTMEIDNVTFTVPPSSQFSSRFGGIRSRRAKPRTRRALKKRQRTRRT